MPILTITALACSTNAAFASGGLYATHASPGYVPGCATDQSVTNDSAFFYPATNTLTSLRWVLTLPAGWSLITVWGDGSPEIGAIDKDISFIGNISKSPIVFHYTVNVPAHESGAKSLSANVEYLLNGMVNPASLWAEPDPLPVPELRQVFYVSRDGRHIAPFTNWSMAATNIQSAVDMANGIDGSTVQVSNGLYYLTAAVTVTNGITVQGVSGAANTLINGGRVVRGFYVAHSNAVVDGFTITNCAAGTGLNGGGVYVAPGLVRNCRLLQNAATNAGGGAAVGTGGVLRNCLLWGNTAENNGGGVRFSGGGVLESCTISANSAATNGGGVYADAGTTGVCVNTIVYQNAAGGLGSNWAVSAGQKLVFTNSCIAPASGTGFAGVNTIGSDPAMVDVNTGNCRLSKSSPSINTGMNQAWMEGAADLDGRRRKDVFFQRVDMGAYEYLPALILFKIR